MGRGLLQPRALGAGAGATALAAAGYWTHRELARRIQRDPQSAALRQPEVGTPETAVSSDGTRLHVERFGAADAPVVVLIHGWTESIPYWTYLVRDLSRAGVSVLAYDLRGHGQSARAAGGDYSMVRFGEDLEAVLAQCVPPGERAVLVGHSLGAMSIAAWAEHHDVPARAAGTVLVNAGVGDMIVESLLVPVPRAARAMGKLLAVHGFMGARAPLPRFSTPISHAAIRYMTFGPRGTPAQVAFFERMLVACPPDVRADVGIAISEMELHHALANLTVPTTVIAGERDRMTPPTHARRIARTLPQLQRLEILPGVGHMAPLESPRDVLEAVLELVPAPRAAASAAA